MAASPSPTPQELTVTDLVARARSLAGQPGRTILGIAGAPGSGKSTVAAELVQQLGSDAVLVPMDGFHLANEVLRGLGRQQSKGAPDTFDAGGYVALLRRLSGQLDDTVYAPAFRREIEEPIAASIAVHRRTPLVITEGNYLLLPDEPWAQVRGLLDAAWFLLPEESVRQERLIARHVAFGKAADAAREWALGSDQRNADLVADSALRADGVFQMIGPR